MDGCVILLYRNNSLDITMEPMPLCSSYKDEAEAPAILQMKNFAEVSPPIRGIYFLADLHNAGADATWINDTKRHAKTMRGTKATEFGQFSIMC